MRILPPFIVIIFTLLSCHSIPQVYSYEKPPEEYQPVPLLPLEQLESVPLLPDPFEWSNGKGRSTKFSDWEKRRNEIKAEIEYYEIGTKPDKPEKMIATFTDSILTVTSFVNERELTLQSTVHLPEGEGPFPVMIGIRTPTGSLPPTIFTENNIATVSFNHDQVTSYSKHSTNDPFYQLYPACNTENSGQYSAWVWGISRILDGLELVQNKLPVDLKHIGVTGCSYAGKMALFAGAFDERIALTIAQESGGGGAPAWRVSETLGEVEKLGVTNTNWFKDDLFQFSDENVSKLPYDHHELMAMVAPRALLITGNTDYEWLANPSAFVSTMAAREVYKEFQIPDRLGLYIAGNYRHCSVPDEKETVIKAFVKRFLLNDQSIDTDILIHPYDSFDYKHWYSW